jgi:MoaA/NifB/PqqE/SkfB family radical SAM enzyme
MMLPIKKTGNIISAQWSIVGHRKKVSGTPIVMFLEVSNVCNIRCQMCATTFDPRFQKGTGYTGLMDISVLDCLQPILPKLWRAYLMGNGEPLLNPHFLDFAQRLKHHKVEIQFNTNGMLLTPEISEELVAMGTDAIAISMDGADADTFNTIRRGADFDQVIANIKTLNQMKARKHSDKPHLSMAVVALKDNYQQMPQLVQLAKELGMGHVHVESLIWQDDPEYQKYYQEHALIIEEDPPFAPPYNSRGEDSAPFNSPRRSKGEIDNYAKAKLLEAYHQAKELRVGFSSPLLHNLKAGKIKGIPCWEPWTTIFVTWQGEIHPCCGSEQEMGNLQEQDIIKIWNGDEYKQLREEMIKYGRLMTQKENPPFIPPYNSRGEKILEGCRICIKNQRMKRVIPTFRQWIRKTIS